MLHTPSLRGTRSATIQAVQKRLPRCALTTTTRRCNRIGIGSCVSPLLKMSFETAAHFLMSATMGGDRDDLRSPAARLCVGRVVDLGTGVMDMVQNLPGE